MLTTLPYKAIWEKVKVLEVMRPTQLLLAVALISSVTYATTKIHDRYMLHNLRYCDPEGKQMLDYLNHEINTLQDMKEKYELKIARYQDLGDRLQFQQNNLSDARRYWALAAKSKEMVCQINHELTILRSQRIRLERKLDATDCS